MTESIRSRTWLSKASDWNGTGVLSILGPTGSGKTSLALTEVKKRFASLKEPLLVSLDAVALYRHLDIGSAKPMGEERIPYDWVGLDLVDPRETVSANAFRLAVLPGIERAISMNRPVILVGGSHFYEKMIVNGPSPGEGSDPAYIKSLESISSEELFRALCAKDARFGQKLHVNDRYRLTRYSDLVIRQGLGFDHLVDGPRADSLLARTDVYGVKLGLDLDETERDARLRKRISEMFRSGWMNEVQSLLEKGYSLKDPGLQTIGYFEICTAIDQSQSHSRAIDQIALEEQILVSHRQLSKKQRTWIRGL